MTKKKKGEPVPIHFQQPPMLRARCGAKAKHVTEVREAVTCGRCKALVLPIIKPLEEKDRDRL